MLDSTCIAVSVTIPGLKPILVSIKQENQKEEDREREREKKKAIRYYSVCTETLKNSESNIHP